MNRVRLSIITVTMNDFAGLRRTLRSIERQSSGLDQIECIVVDGGCDAEVKRIVEQCPAFSLTLISEADAGVYDGMNKGWRAARGEYVQFLNSGDALADAGSLAAILAGLRSGPLWAVFGALHLMAGRSTPVLIGNLPHRWWRHTLGLQPHCHQSTFFRRDLIDGTGGYALEQGFIADFDLILRIGLLAPAAENPDVVVHYEGGGISAGKGAEIPPLQSRCRRSRLQLSGPMLAAERLWTRYVLARHAARTVKARLARRTS